MSHKKNDKFHRQVEELLVRGLVKERMSLCAVLTLIVPKKDETWHMCVDRSGKYDYY